MFRSLWFWVLVLLLALAGGSIFLSRPSAPPPAPDTLVQLAGKGDVAGAQRLLEQGAYAQARDSRGNTALMHA
ncbi:MAG: hypothetical protein IJR28_06805, partial [Ottowia sp.]|nr:hypothetical protein [Ottowia sp.]